MDGRPENRIIRPPACGRNPFRTPSTGSEHRAEFSAASNLAYTLARLNAQNWKAAAVAINLMSPGLEV